MVTEISRRQSESVPSEHVIDDEYKLEGDRKGGCFVTTKKALFFVFAAIGAIVLAVALMYFYGPHKNQTQENNDNDLEKLLTNTSPPKLQPTHHPSTLRPLHYKLQIHPTLQTTFTGTIEILLFCLNKTESIILNVEDLHINEGSVKIVEQKKKQKLFINNKNYDTKKLVYTIKLNTPLEANGNYTLHAEFSGNISDDFVGIYRTIYNRNKTLIATNFQAKRAFPCLDVPSLRATFEIAIARQTNMVAVSNMPLLKSEPLLNTTGWMCDHFQTTPPMPVHLVAFTVCDCKGSLVGETHRARIWTVDVAKNLSFAEETLRTIMPFLEDYFDTKFPFPKIDFVVVPNMVEYAVNGWGLVFFRASSILLEDNTLKEHIFQQIASQLSQQWFGGLVDMNEWLIKGFALFISQLMLDEYHLLPQIHSNYVTKTLDSAFAEEAITDKKVASLLRMLFDVVPENTFKKALKVFLEKWRYKTALTGDLWGSFTDRLSNNLTVVEFVENWINKSGYPLVHVRRKNRVIDVAQTNFIDLPPTKWPIPLSYIVSSDVNVSKFLWLVTEKAQIKLDGFIKNNTWVVFNANETGFYRINYDRQNWLLLQKQLENNFSVIATKNRAQILNDALNLAAVGYLDYNTALNLTKYLLNEDEYLPWAAAFDSFKDIRLAFANTHYQETFKKYVVKLTEKVYNKTIDQTHLSNLILHNRCDVQEETCVNWAKRLFAKWMNSSEPIPYSVRKIAQCAAITAGNQKEWEFLLQNANDSELAYLSLGCSRQSWIINKYLELALRGDIQIQYVPIVWKSLDHPVAINSGFKFLRSNWKRIKNAYWKDTLVLKSIFLDFLSRLSTNVDLEDLTTFYKKEEGSLKEVAAMLLKAVERIKLRIQWSTKHLVEVAGWMKNNTLTSQ